MTPLPKHYFGGASDLGVHVNGSQFGPAIIMEDLIGQKTILDRDPSIVKSLKTEDRRKNYQALYAYLHNLYDLMAQRPQDEFVTMIGGDHSVAIASALAGNYRYHDLGLIWIDAHTDYHTMASTVSGNLHGLPCAEINGYGSLELSKYHKGNYILPSKTVIVGARSIDDGEYVNLDVTKAQVITIEEVYQNGIASAMDKAFKIASQATYGVHVSYDLDFLDPSIAPGVSTPVAHGGDLEVYEGLLKSLKKYRSLIKTFDLVEYNPLNDSNQKTADLAKRIILEGDF